MEQIRRFFKTIEPLAPSDHERKQGLNFADIQFDYSFLANVHALIDKNTMRHKECKDAKPIKYTIMPYLESIQM